MKVPKQSLSQRATIGLVAVCLSLGFGAGALAADVRLSDADANLEKAWFLIQAGKDVTGEMNEKDDRTYDRILARAQADIDKARQQVAHAIEFSDNTP